MSELTDNPDFDDIDDCCEHGIGFDEECEECENDFGDEDWEDFLDEDDE